MALLASLGQQRRAGGSFENLADTLVGSCGAFQVLVGSNLLADFLTLETPMSAIRAPRPVEGAYLFGGDRLLRGLVQLFVGLGVVTEVHLAADKDDGEALAEV